VSVDRELQQHLEDAVKRHRVPGASLAVFAGETLREAAAGVVNIRTGVETTPDAVFEIGSITKVFTTTLVLQLADAGALELDAPLRHYLPELVLADLDAAARVTVRHLLTHMSGIDGDFFQPAGRGDDCLERYVLACTALPFVSQPGELWSYCNAGFSLLGRVIEKLCGSTWDEALRLKLLKPLATEGMQTLPEEKLRYRVAAGHFLRPENGELFLAPLWRGMRASGPAGATPVAMARDLVRFARMHLDGGVADGGRRVLSAAAVREMQTRQVTLPPPDLASGWGLGWMLFDGPVFGHNGGTMGQASFLRVAPERRVAVALLTNGGNPTALFREVVGAALGRYAGTTLPEVPEPNPAAAVDESLYLGRYARYAATLEIAQEAGLVLKQHWLHPTISGTPDPPPLPLEPFDAGAFIGRAPATGEKLAVRFFEPDARGRPRYLRLEGRVHRRID
jgi:CubicO group peptidase (beta-lactamase class C family)